MYNNDGDVLICVLINMSTKKELSCTSRPRRKCSIGRNYDDNTSDVFEDSVYVMFCFLILGFPLISATVVTHRRSYFKLLVSRSRLPRVKAPVLFQLYLPQHRPVLRLQIQIEQLVLNFLLRPRPHLRSALLRYGRNGGRRHCRTRTSSPCCTRSLLISRS
jgi:hypothetical protein